MGIMVHDENIKEKISRLRQQVFEDFSVLQHEDVEWKASLLYHLMNPEFYTKNVPYTTGLSSTDILYFPAHDCHHAEKFYQDSLKIIRRKKGKSDLDYVKCLYVLALLKVVTNEIESASALFEKAIQAEDSMIVHIFSTASEEQQTALLEVLKYHLDLFLSFVLIYYASSPLAVKNAMDVALRRKSIVSEARKIYQNTPLRDKDAELRNKITTLNSLRKKINNLMLSGPLNWDDQNRVDSFFTNLKQLSSKKQSLEFELAKTREKTPLKLELNYSRKIADSLPQSDVVVEFIHLSFFNFEALTSTASKLWMSPRYIAFVLFGRGSPNIYLLDLGDANIIDQLIYFYKSFVTKKKGVKKFLASRKRMKNTHPIGSTLRRTIFDPLLTIMSSCRRLYISPDGEITKIPFEILPINNSTYVIDKFYITYLSSSKDIVSFNKSTIKSFSKSVVIADPNFDLGSDDDSTLSVEETVIPPGPGYLVSPYFRRLPGTRKEGKVVGKMLGVKPHMGNDALESYITTSKSPYILHLSTHGFFLEKQPYYIEEGMIFAPLTESIESLGMMNRLTGYNLNNPMLRSGLALAGANTWIKHGSIPDEYEDSIVTGEDVSLLDLSNTALVVLSACETGLGDVLNGEGVFGLRRAFVLAGAQTLVMSLWKVPDGHTKELMIDFYSNLLDAKPRAEALREAQLSMKRKYPDPYYWGAFICQGNPGPLPNSFLIQTKAD